MEPICVLLKAPTALVDSAATSALLSPDRAVVNKDEAWPVVRAPTCTVLRLLRTEATCVLVRALTCVLLSEAVVRAPNWVVESCDTLPVEIAAVCAVPRLAN